MSEFREFGDAQTFNNLELKMDLSRVNWMKSLAFSNGCKDPMGVLDTMMSKGEWPSAARISKQSETFYWLDIVASDYIRLNALYNLVAREIMLLGNESLKTDLIKGYDTISAREGELKLRGFARSAPYGIVLQLINELDQNYTSDPDHAETIFESNLKVLFDLIPTHSNFGSLQTAYSELIGA